MKEQARERDVSASHEAVYVDPELLKNHIEPPHTTSSQDTIFSRTRRIQGPAEVDIVDCLVVVEVDSHGKDPE